MDYNQTPLDSGLSQDLTVTAATRSYLHEAARWAKFIAIVGFVFVGLFVMVALFFVVGFSSTEIPGLGRWGGAFGIIYLLIALLYFFPLLYLFRFAEKTKYAVERQSSVELESGIENLKANFKFVGIMLLVVIGLYALIFVIALIGGFAGAFS
jgi:hypothetical protein